MHTCKNTVQFSQFSGLYTQTRKPESTEILVHVVTLHLSTSDNKSKAIINDFEPQQDNA